jgi:hypothetical protein
VRQHGFKVHCDMPLSWQIGHVLAHEFKRGVSVSA